MRGVYGFLITRIVCLSHTGGSVSTRPKGRSRGTHQPVAYRGSRRSTPTARQTTRAAFRASPMGTAVTSSTRSNTRSEWSFSRCSPRSRTSIREAGESCSPGRRFRCRHREETWPPTASRSTRSAAEVPEVLRDVEEPARFLFSGARSPTRVFLPVFRHQKTDDR
jgi:hypothetical protein